MKRLYTSPPSLRYRAAARTWLVAAAICTGLGTPGCAAKKRDTAAAKVSAYDADFAIVFSEVIGVVEKLYPQYDDDPVRGVIKTAWHQVSHNASMDDPNSAQVRARASGGSNPAATSSAFGNQVSGMQKRFFVRFDIKIVAPRPFEITIIPHAAEWEAGNAVPSEMKSNNIPAWLPGRTDALRMQIYRKLRKHAVRKVDRVQLEAPKEDPIAAEADALALGALPDDAEVVVRKVYAAALARDAARMRPHMADEFAWDARSTPSADTAVVVWQADTAAMDALERAIGDGCAMVGAEIRCHDAVFAKLGAAWKFISFVPAPPPAAR